MAGSGRKVFTAGDVLTASDVQNYLMDQTTMVFAGTAARSSAIATPTEGMFAVTTDNDELDYYNGSAWVPALPVGAWQTWAPTLSSGWANGNGVWSDSKYCQIGKTVHFRATFTLGSTTTKGAGLVCSLPVTGSGSGLYNINGTFQQGTTRNTGFNIGQSTTQITMGVSRADTTYVQYAAVTSLIPFTWATGDIIWFTGTYEAA